jgi:hypothetical protein
MSAAKSGGKRKTPEAPSEDEVNKCLVKVRELAKVLRDNAHKSASTPSELGYTNLLQVADNSSEQGAWPPLEIPSIPPPPLLLLLPSASVPNQPPSPSLAASLVAHLSHCILPRMPDHGVGCTAMLIRAAVGGAVRAKIERLAAQVINNIMAGDGLAYTLPRGGGANVKFVEELDQNFLEYNPMKRQFADASQVKYAARSRATPTRSLLFFMPALPASMLLFPSSCARMATLSSPCAGHIHTIITP